MEARGLPCISPGYFLLHLLRQALFLNPGLKDFSQFCLLCVKIDIRWAATPDEHFPPDPTPEQQLLSPQGHFPSLRAVFNQHIWMEKM